MATNKILEYLTLFKNFPTYQLERRLDAFMLPFLEEGIKKELNNLIKNDATNLVFVYPEFPIKRKDSIKKDKIKLSEYADYLMWSSYKNTVYLVEFKTDIKSIDELQFQSYFINAKNGWEVLINYYFEKAINNKFWRKYVHGLIHIQEKAPVLLGINNRWNLNEYLKKGKGKGIHKKLSEIKQGLKFEDQAPKLKFIYLAPFDAKLKLDEYVNRNIEIKEFYIGLITLQDFAEHVDDPLKNLLKEI